MRTAKYSLLAVFLAVPVLAQTDATYLLLSNSTVSPNSPTTTIEIWATWVDPGARFVFGAGDYDLTAGDGVFSNPVNMLPGFGSTTGVIGGNVITGARFGRWLLCGFPGCPPVENPILLATYDWTATDFTPRAVDLRTSNTSTFVVGIPGFPNPLLVIQLYPHEFAPGSGVINVVPAPAAWFALALPLVAATRRRRP